MMGFSYLASPYQNPDDSTDRWYCEQRFEEACHAASILMTRGHTVFCPIAMSHPIADHLDAKLRCSHEFWLKHDFAILEKADRLIVLQLFQWERSHGVAEEIKFATERMIPIAYLDPNILP